MLYSLTVYFGPFVSLSLFYFPPLTLIGNWLQKMILWIGALDLVRKRLSTYSVRFISQRGFWRNVTLRLVFMFLSYPILIYGHSDSLKSLMVRPFTLFINNGRQWYIHIVLSSSSFQSYLITLTPSSIHICRWPPLSWRWSSTGERLESRFLVVVDLPSTFHLEGI